MTCVRRLAGAQRPAPSAPADSARPDPRPGRRRVRLSLLLPALALLLGALSLFDSSPAQAQAEWSATLTPQNIGNGFLGCDDTLAGVGTIYICEPSGALTDDDFTVGGTGYEVESVDLNSVGGAVRIKFDTAPDTALKALNFCVGSRAFEFSSATFASSGTLAQWRGISPALSWTAGTGVSLKIGRGSSCTEAPPPPAVSLSLSRTSVPEDSTVTLTATLREAAPAGGANVHFRVVNASGIWFPSAHTLSPAGGAQDVTAAIPLAEGQTTATATLTFPEDSYDTGDVGFKVFADVNFIGTLQRDERGFIRNGVREYSHRRTGAYSASAEATLTLVDNDTAGVTVTAANPFRVPEFGTNTYTVVLDAKPTADVMVRPTSSSDAIIVSPLYYTFNPDDTWNQPRTFTVHGVNDPGATGHKSFTIGHTVAEFGQRIASSPYANISVATLTGQWRHNASGDLGASGQQAGASGQEVAGVSAATAGDAVAVHRYAALIAQMYEWRNDPRYVNHKSHTDRWDRALLAFGETVADSSLTAMTAAEAQAFADKGWERWVEVAEALREIESGGVQATAQAPVAPVVTIAAGEAVTEGTAAGFTLAAAPAPASDLDVTVTVGQEGAFLHSSTLGAHTVTIPAGFESASFTVLTVDDAADEPDGSVTATLGTGTGYAVGDAASASVAVADDDGTQNQVVGTGGGPYAALITQMYEWRNDPRYVSHKSHTDRWDRALLAFGETVADGTLTAMSAAEAQAFADRGWARWVEVAKALWQIAGGRPTPVPAIDTKRGIAREGSDDAVVFTVSLDRAASETVSVDYATADGAGSWASTAPAAAGADYTATSGTLAFAPGETSKSVSVAILDDSIDEGTEYFLLRFSNPQGATLAAGERETQGLIRNTDPLQAMWLARFGRMVASDAVASVTARLETPRDAGSHVTFAGQRMNFGEDEGGGGAALATVLTGLAQTFGAPSAPAADEDDPFARLGFTDPWNDPASSTARSMTGRELLLGTSFRAVLGSGSGPQWMSWGQGASVSRFSAAVPGLGLSGEAATGSMGMDYEHGRLLTGFAMTHSVGEGTAQDAGWRYALGSTATMAMPYARLALSDRVSAWGLAGTGTGRLTLDLDGSVPQSYRTDLSMTLAAVGMRGDLLAPTAPGEFALALKADAFWVRTESEAVTASEFGSLAGARGESSRVRALLDGSRTFALAGGATLAPSVELGVRHDGGDAETGTGLEFGAGLGYADPSRGLDMALRVIDMGVGAAEVAKPGNVALLMKQTLLPKLCPACALDRPAERRAAPGSSPVPGSPLVPEGLVSRLGGLDGLRFRNPEGCAECRREDGGEVSARAWNGYLGQTAICETIRPDAGYLGFVRRGDPLGAWAYWRSELGGVPIGVRIRAMVKQGVVDPFDALLKGGAGEHEAQADRRTEDPAGSGEAAS